MIIYTVYSVVLRKGLRVHLNHAALPFSRLIHLGSEFTDLLCIRGLVSIASFHSLYSTVAFLSSVFCYFTRLSPHSMANTSRLDNAQPGFYDDLPTAAQTVPRSTLLHTILFKRISFPLTSRLDELWVNEVDQSGHETWSSLEEFICRFCPPVDPHVLQPWAASWREHFDIPAPTANTSQDPQYPVLPQPNHARARVGRPASWIPDHSHILRACWGRSASRFSQGDPFPSLLQPVAPVRAHPGVPSSRSTQPESEPHSYLPPTSTLTTSTTSSHVMEMNQEDDHS